jgi:hypothetical protein
MWTMKKHNQNRSNLKNLIKYGIALFALLLVLLVSMHDFASYPKSLDPLFEKAGSNQSELKKVIRHYSIHEHDSLKIRAAIFLIRNMDAHCSWESKAWVKMQEELEELYKIETDRDKLKGGFDSIYKQFDLSGVRYRSDLHIIKSDFLIKNIDSAFVKWRKPYARHLNFDEFCEYILPYRVNSEPLDNWREMFGREYIPGILASIKKPKDSITAADICDALKGLENGYLHYLPRDVPDYNIRMLLTAKIATCKDYSSRILFAARCIGIPVALDHTPQWANRSLGHEWNALITEDRKPLDFGIKDNCKLGMHIQNIPDRIAPKVYRQTYAKQQGSLACICGSEKVPHTLASPCMKDVTAEYYSTVDVPVRFDQDAPGKNRFAYLAVFDNKDWIPVAWAKLVNKSAIFKDLHKGIVCLPGYYHQKRFEPAAYPVKIDSVGKITELRPDYKNTRTLVLNRKYQTSLMEGTCRKMIGVRLQAADDSSFIHPVDLYQITEMPQACYELVTIKPARAYKYYRYLSPRRVTCNLAELEFYEAGDDAKLVGKVIGGYMEKFDSTLLVPYYIRKLKAQQNSNFQLKTSWISKLQFATEPAYPKGITGKYGPQPKQTTEKSEGKSQRHLPDTCYVNAFDGDPLTFFCRYSMEYSWVGMEFSNPKRINKVAFLPRNDDNGVMPGQLYELFFWNKKWVSLGRQTASNKTYRLSYKNVPSNALFLLRNLTKGKEERIFTYEGGKQVWW